MKVYRVMHKKYGVGPYAALNSLWAPLGMLPFWRRYLDLVLGEHTRLKDHPTPQDDGLMTEYHDTNMVFGFADLDTCIRWWGPIWHHLEELGFDIYELEVPENEVHVSRSGWQCMFHCQYLGRGFRRPTLDEDILDIPVSEPRDGINCYITNLS